MEGQQGEGCRRVGYGYVIGGVGTTAEEEGGQRRAGGGRGQGRGECRVEGEGHGRVGVCDRRAGDHKRGIWRGRRCGEEGIWVERRQGEGEGEEKYGREGARKGGM